MDLIIVSTSIDFAGVKSGACRNCLEKKLDTKVIKVFPKAFSSLKEFKKCEGLKGFMIECICGNHVSLYHNETNTTNNNNTNNTNNSNTINEIKKIKELKKKELKKTEKEVDEEQYNIATNYAIDLSTKI